MSSRLRSVAIIELLAKYPPGLTARAIAGQLDIPLPATERLLQEMIQSDYLALAPDGQHYRLRLKLAALGLAYLGASGVTDLVQPILDDLAKRCGELVRLAVIEGEQLTWVAKAQGSRSGLMYNPDASAAVKLPSTANGQAWLSRLGREEVERLIEQHGDVAGIDRGELMRQLDLARDRGFAFVSESYQTGTSAIATAVLKPGGGRPIGTVSIAGPTLRMTDARIEQMALWLKSTADELGAASTSSPLFGSR